MKHEWIGVAAFFGSALLPSPLSEGSALFWLGYCIGLVMERVVGRDRASPPR